ncbi:MAG: Nif3-like dinuclear metal center hexameric protein, partial [Thermoleophilaceae bacterium]
MASRDDVIAFLDELLDAPGWPDFGPNGLQVPGAPEVERVVTGVSAHLELFERAVSGRAQLVLCHHGIFWDKQPRALDSQAKHRLEALFRVELSLAADHRPRDAHPDVGNNAPICAALGLERAEPFAEHGGRLVGGVGRSAEGVEIGEFLDRCRRAFGQE